MPALLAEQERLMPLLERLLGLAALWADPPVLGGEAAGPGAPAGLRFARVAGGSAGAAMALPATAQPVPAMSAGVAAGGPGLSVLPVQQPAAAGLRTFGTGAGAEAARGFGAGPDQAGASASRPEAGFPSPPRVPLPPALPVASLGRLRERAGTRLADPARSGAVLAAAPGTAAMPFAALAAAAATPLDPGARPAGPSPPVGAVGVVEAAPLAATPPVTAAPPASRAAATPGGLAAWAAAGATDALGLPGDALEERLADILERAAAEAGINLP
jgi:hypothetical protein